MTDFSWLGAVITFQVTFTELFIAATVLIAGAYRFGWRSLLVGSVLGAAAVAVLAWALQAAAYRFALHLLDGIAAALLLTFGINLLWEFLEGLGDWDGGVPAPRPTPSGWGRPHNLAGLGVGFWALVTEGLEILVVWLGVALREGAATATLGVALGVAITGALAATLGRTGVFRSVPPFLLDGAAPFMVVAYGSYFLASALTDG